MNKAYKFSSWSSKLLRKNSFTITRLFSGTHVPLKWRTISGSIVPDYGLVDWAIGVRSLSGTKDFSSNLYPDRLWGPPSLLFNGSWVSFPGG
jgi:hypothetical protein